MNSHLLIEPPRPPNADNNTDTHAGTGTDSARALTPRAARRLDSRLTWRRLLVAAAVGNLAPLAWLGLTGQDELALGLAVALAVGIGLTRFRGGTIGRTVLGLVFVDMTWYTVSGAVWNLLNREPMAAVLVPAWLGALAVAGLVAAIASVVVGRSKPEAGRTGATIIAAVAVACFALALAASAVLGSADKSTPTHSTIPLVTKNMAYSSTQLTTDAGQVTVRLNNHDLFWHTFTIDALGVVLKVPINGDESVTFDAAPGRYNFYCTIPGHAIGMHGTLVVR